MLYRCQANHDGLQAGTVYDLDPADVAYREGAIEAGFLTAERPVAVDLSLTDDTDGAGEPWSVDDPDGDEPG